MEVKLFHNFKKRRNSTKQPSGGTSYECVCKDPCDIVNPDIILNVGTTKRMTNYNYAFIGDFERYYYVQWEVANGRWIAHMNCDVMASFKNDIGNANLYIERAANAFNTTIRDSNYAITSQVDTFVLDGTCPWIRYDASSSGGSTGGFYVVGVAGAGNNGAITYYGMDKLYFQQFSAKLYNTTDWLKIDWQALVGLTEQVMKALVNPGQYIVSAKWFPLDVYGAGIPMTDTVKFGWWDIPQQCYIVDFPSLVYHIGTFDFHRHPQAKTQHGDFTDFKPYTYHYFYTPPFGIIDIDRSNYRDNLMSVDVWIDMITGEAELRFNTSTGKMIKNVKVPFAVDVPLLQLTMDYGSALGSTMTMQAGQLSGLGAAVGAALSKRPSSVATNVAGGISEIINSTVSGIGNTISALNPQAEIINSQSSYMDFINNTYELRSKHYMVSPLSRQNIGQVLADTRNVASLGGYILPAEVAFEMGGCLKEQIETRNIMSGGFYFE